MLPFVDYSLKTFKFSYKNSFTAKILYFYTKCFKKTVFFVKLLHYIAIWYEQKGLNAYLISAFKPLTSHNSHIHGVSS